MNVLLDTHTLLWYYLDDPRLSPLARTTIQDPTNRVFVSPASHWEVAVKLSLGKYSLQIPFLEFVRESIFDNGFFVLPIEVLHTGQLIGLPFHHRDPFDRLLIAQAVAEGLAIISADPTFDAYPIQRIW